MKIIFILLYASLLLVLCLQLLRIPTFAFRNILFFLMKVSILNHKLCIRCTHQNIIVQIDACNEEVPRSFTQLKRFWSSLESKTYCRWLFQCFFFYFSIFILYIYYSCSWIFFYL